MKRRATVQLQVADARGVNLHASLPVKFFDEGHDTPDAAPSLGVAGWTEGRQVAAPHDETTSGNPSGRQRARGW